MKPERKMFYPPVEEELGYSMFTRAGNTLYVSGIVGHVNGTFSQDPAVQYEAAYKNIAEALAVFGVGLEAVAMERVYFTKALNAMDPVQRKQIRQKAYKGSWPSSTWIQVESLVESEIMVEIETVVILP
jgi:enamine deaminase RidA (YjgF/YER057c/UK114 family)